MSADSELNSVLIRRQEINDALDNGHEVQLKYKVVNVYTEFHEFTRKEIKQYETTFKKFNTNNDSYLTLDELKRMMEVLGAPQTHIGLKGMIAEVDEDDDGRLSFREFLLVYRKARAGELDADSGLGQLAKLTEVDVDKVGVNGAKEFFEAKINELSKKSKFENEIREEQEQRKQMEEEKAIRRQQFLETAALFK
ncbi:PREDICTED: EF-hand domain-containing protein D2 homolog isoform X2 [Nicrophorus vespilloides]|uniref:EF-hand domain-containing protein D2 homolog isoform X1 n=1 Tax=Nicrophorus vespilloides TaxID=110193 RepID=A0ABM1M796_NICVS|nr:PREDICTED: EF-hand domain-containing protein D2 homolog isoform X1 [Nicrophorus vespilloides]XP_017770447.1 PREDICTED: EF-hand domain-containing protein D2 homolog isoform X2 [Nicrophorus vespilloides]